MDQPASEVVTMDAPKPEEWLSRETIDRVIEGMSAGDLVESMGEHGGDSVQMPTGAFNRAAARMGVSNGTPATDHIHASDFRYLGESIGKAVNLDSPLSEGQED